MVPDRKAAGRRKRQKVRTHRKSASAHSAFTRTVAAGGAAIAIGVAYEMTAPTAEAVTIRFIGPAAADGSATNMTEINIFEGNIFNPQFGIGGAGSNNNVIGNIVVNIGNQIINSFFDVELNFGAAAVGAGNGNVTQVNLFSYNIFNPQITLGANVSTNTTVNNVSMNNGNDSSTTVSGGGLPLIGGAMGNGNTTQISLFSGNIFNPQWGSSNTSYNTAATNVAANNGNNSSSSLFGGLFGNFLFGGGGNGNVTQIGLFVSNIWNPQFAFGAGNVSNNTSTTNSATNNGNGSSSAASGGVLGTVVVGTSGNGNVNQTAGGSGNIWNDQVNIGTGTTGSNTTNNTVTTGSPQPPVVPGPVGGNVITDDTEIDISAAAANDTQSATSGPGTGESAGAIASAIQDTTPSSGAPSTPAPTSDPAGPATVPGGGGGGDGAGDGTGDGGGAGSPGDGGV
jgi:hypothetical protein